MDMCLKVQVSGAAEGGQSWASLEDQRTPFVQEDFPMAPPASGLVQGFTRRLERPNPEVPAYLPYFGLE